MEPIHSNWGDWLPRAVAAAEPDGLAAWYLGCNGFVLKSAGGATLFVDPYLGTGDPPRTVRMIPVPFDPVDVVESDAVLATHEHTDHVHGPSQAPILERTGADFYAPDASLDVVDEEGWLGTWDVDATQFEAVDHGDTLQIGDLTVSVESADDPDAEHPVSYVVEHPSGTFFHAGDARAGGFGSVGERYDIDLGAVAFGTVGMIPDSTTREPKRTKWYNDENMVIEAANELQLTRLVPTHWDMWRGLTADPSALSHHASSFGYPERLDVVRIGDRLDI
jgi:L-ascorbate 6-phosphate lactonase